MNRRFWMHCVAAIVSLCVGLVLGIEIAKKVEQSRREQVLRKFFQNGPTRGDARTFSPHPGESGK